MMRAFHGLGLDVRDDELFDQFSLLHRLDRYEGPASLVIERADPPRTQDLERLSKLAQLRHGSIRGFVRDQGATGRGFSVFDGHSKIEVTRDRLVFETAEASLEDGYTFRTTTAFIAFALALRLRGWFHHHAALLTSPLGAPILLLGEGGSGKTTTALACLEAGYLYATDDATFVTQDLALLGTPALFHVSERTAHAFPDVATALGQRYRENNDKRELDPRTAFPGRERSSAGLPRLIVAPSVHTGPTALVPWTQAETLGALITASAFLVVDQMPLAREQLEVERRLASSTAGAELRLGPDALSRPSIIPRLIGQALGE